MLFNSHEFIFIYLPLIFVGFYFIGKHSQQFALCWLIFASIFFYGWWNPKYVSLLIASIAFNYVLFLFIKNSTNTKYKKLFLYIGITLNISLLFYYKYYNFFITSINQVSTANISSFEILLPLGISFFTFTQIAFLVDSYKGFIRGANFLNYLLFVTYFPHLLAGPLLHHTEMMQQFSNKTTFKFNYLNIASGVTLFTIGLAKKVLIADEFASYANLVFNSAENLPSINFITAWVGAISYALQIYFDFSGYSDMAIGIALLFNIHLPINFDSPYKSSSIIEFWRRWHITLSRFLRNYLYIPLGGNKKGLYRRHLNLLITMVLGGLWHGANWTFIIWGGLHGFYLLINHLWRNVKDKFSINISFGNFLNKAFGICITFVLVTIAWVFFRANSVHGALNLLSDMFGLSLFSKDIQLDYLTIKDLIKNQFNGFHLFISSNGLGILNIFILMLISFFIIWVLPNSQNYICRKNSFLSWHSSSKLAIFWGLVLGICLIKMVKISEFIYFQF